MEKMIFAPIKVMDSFFNLKLGALTFEILGDP